MIDINMFFLIIILIKLYFKIFLNGSFFNFSSKGNNNLNNTNNLKSRIINDFNFKFNDLIFMKILVKK